MGGPFIFDCGCNLHLLNLSNIPAFYIDILKEWMEVQELSTVDFDTNGTNCIFRITKILLKSCISTRFC